MLILDENAGPPTLSERRPMEPVLVAGGLFVLLGLLPLFGPGAVTAPRVATSLALGAGAGLCYALGRVRVRPRPFPAGSPVRLELVGVDALEGYRAVLVTADGLRHTVLARNEPSGVLKDALALGTRLGVPVEAGWGLDEKAWAILSAPSEGSPSDLGRASGSHRPLPDQRIGAWTAIWAAGFIAAATTAMALSPARPSIPPGALELILPGLTSLISLGIGLWLLGLREQLVIDAGCVERSRTMFGRQLTPKSNLALPVRGVFPVSPRTSGPEHLLLATANGPLAIPTDPQAGAGFSLYPQKSDRAPGRAAE